MSRLRPARHSLPVALIAVALTIAAVHAGAAIGVARQGTPPASPATDDPCAAIVAAGTPVAGHGEAPGALDPVPAEQSGEVGNPGDYPFDLVFIDALIPHHEGAIRIAKVGLVRAEHEELRALGQLIVETRSAEIAQLQDWRGAWYGGVDPVPQNVAIGLLDEGLMRLGGPADTGAGMGGPVVDTAADAYFLCTAPDSFDLAFIDRMIPRQQGAVGMAMLAVERAEHSELRTLAETIVADQGAEIAQMTDWRIAWAAEAAES